MPDALLTVAERSDWTATASHEQTVALLESLADSALPGAPLARLAEMGRTAEGRSIPLLILADPPVATARDARESGRVVALVFGCIHAGEVCGKEALPILAREIMADPAAPDAAALLKDVVLVLAPIYNGDGNDRFGPTEEHRPGQVGPEQGVGTRANAMDLDLNRDYMKLDAPETRAMVRFMNEWDPHLIIDTHTTNGSWHRYVLTWAAPQNPNGAPGPIGFVRDVMLPEAAERVEARHGWRTFTYGDFDDDHTRWSTYPPFARFGGAYHGLRGRLSILSEAYSYATYKERVLATRDFVRECLLIAAERAAQVRSLCAEADRHVASLASSDAPGSSLGLRLQIGPTDAPITAAGWEWTKDASGVPTRTDTPRDYTVEHWAKFTPTITRPRPAAYLLPATETETLDRLRLHGIQVRALPPTTDVRTVEVYRIDTIQKAERDYQGRRMRTLGAIPRTEDRALDGVWVEVPLAQPLGTLAALLLEPESDDGLAAWGVLAPDLEPGADFPVLRVPR